MAKVIFGMDTIVEDEMADRVVTFELAEDLKTVEVEEACDRYFRVSLNKEQLGELIRRLDVMHQAMKE